MNPLCKKSILIILIIVAALICPVAALTTFDKLDAILNAHVVTVEDQTDFVYDASVSGDAFYQMEFTVPGNSHINFTLYYGTGSSVEGSAQSTTTGILPPVTTSTVMLNGVSKSYTFWDTDPINDYDIAGYATNGSDFVGFGVYSKDYNSLILGNDLAVGYLVPDITHNLIYKIHFTGTKPFKLTYTIAPTKNIADRVTPGTEGGLLKEVQDIVNFAWSIWNTLFPLLIQTGYWLKFFFWDNLVLIIVLYIALTGAIAFNSTRDVFKAIRNFFKYQKSLFEFILGIWQILINIISSFRGIFRL